MIEHKGKQYDSLEFRVKCFYGTSPSKAFKDMIYIATEEGWRGFDKIEKRSFKVVLRSASVSVDDFIKKKIAVSKITDPIWCLPIKEGYIFIGCV